MLFNNKHIPEMIKGSRKPKAQTTTSLLNCCLVKYLL